MTRRSFIGGLAAFLIGGLILRRALGETGEASLKIEKIRKTPEEWKKILTPDQFHVLREEGTERPNTSPLLHNKEKGQYVCAGCDLPLFDSDMKYNSGTGWPSFFTTIPGRVETKTDFSLIYPRKEYHCARCEGHQGHVFKDGPPPTNLRYCNNGVALKFVPAS